MAKIVGQESPSKHTQILYRRSRKVSNAISTVVNIHSSRNHRARFALDRKIRRDNKRLGRSTIMVDDHRVCLPTRQVQMFDVAIPLVVELVLSAFYILPPSSSPA